MRIPVSIVSDLHVELPPGVDLADAKPAGDTHAAVERAAFGPVIGAGVARR